MTSKLNAAWHRAHRMPTRATLAQRVRWHAGHARACGCREMPASIAAELRRRGITVTRRRT
jgi:hypothetical protein